MDILLIIAITIFLFLIVEGMFLLIQVSNKSPNCKTDDCKEEEENQGADRLWQHMEVKKSVVEITRKS